MTSPTIKKILQEKGQISDELDYALMNYLLKNRGAGYTPCQPQLVELENGTTAIKMGIDNTFIGKDNQLMGLGIVGKILINPDSMEIIYATPKNELEENIEKLEKRGIQPQPRPKGKY